MINTNVTDIVAGDSKVFSIFIDKEDGKPLNLDNCTVNWTCKDISKVAKVVNSSKGNCEIKLTPEDTISLKGVSSHRIKVVDSLGNISTVFQGTLRIS